MGVKVYIHLTIKKYQRNGLLLKINYGNKVDYIP
jgi:hypothetical protein